MPSNVNTLDYWDNRFGSGDREARGGYSQTSSFAPARCKRLFVVAPYREYELCGEQ